MTALHVVRERSGLLPGREDKGVLRFLTCGSVDDGKSTLIGRLLYDTKLLFDDQLAALWNDTRKHGTAGEDIDFALLVDGLEAEREQGITIDVAYRFFATVKRRFIVADTPGHVQYTRNMVTGSSNAQLAVLLVDARAGLMLQTRRHAYIASLLGLRHVVLAVNKIDLVDYSQSRFEEIERAFRDMAEKLAFKDIVAIPLSARFGDNVTTRSAHTPWHFGPTLLDYLETVSVEDERVEKPWRMHVQWVNRPNLDFRGFAGTVASGRVRAGDMITVAASGRQTAIRRIVTRDGDLSEATAGDAITLMLADEIDISRGDMLAASAVRPEVTDQFAAHIVWMADAPLLAGRAYLLKAGTKTVTASVTLLRHKIDTETHCHLAAHQLALNEIGFCNLSLSEPIAVDPYPQNRNTGAFILIERESNATVAAGMVDFGLRRGDNVRRQAVTIDKAARAVQNGQRPLVIWLTGLSGSGKSTIANLVEQKLYAMGHRTYLLDGDNIRHGLNRDLGFTAGDRVQNIRRVGEVAKLFVDAGLIVLASLISPFRSERLMVRDLMQPDEFWEVYVDTPIEICQLRDPKGLYKKAARGEIKNFTGIDSPYEPPAAPDVHIETVGIGAEDAADLLIRCLKDGGRLSGFP